MSLDAQELLIILLALFSPFLLSFLIVAILSPRYQALSERNGWTVQPHPEDRRDYLFKGQQDGIQWEMELYIYEHFRKLTPNHIPFTNVIVWTSKSCTFPHNMLLVYPCKNKLNHFLQPRFSLEKEIDLVTDHDRQKLERDLFALPEKLLGSAEFHEQFALRTDLENVQDSLMKRLQYELLTWPQIQHVGPVILINGDEVTIWWIPIGMRNEWLEKTVHLGTNIANTCQ